MSARVILRPEAARDIVQICDWYDEQRESLGERFLDAFDDSVENLARYPEMCQIVFGNVRRLVMSEFPHNVYYEHEEGVVTIYGVFHGARDSAVWRTRLERS